MLTPSMIVKGRVGAIFFISERSKRYSVKMFLYYDGEFKEVIVLRDIQCLSYEEISDMLGIPAGTVKTRLFHARKHLKTFFTDNDNYTGGQHHEK